MFRYFTDEKQIFEKKVKIVGSDVKHLKNTLRAQIGDEVAIVTSDNEYIAKIISLEMDFVLCEIFYVTDINNETQIHITLCQGIPKQTKMEDIIQQNVEVGVKSFIPLITDRTIVKLNDKSKEIKKLERWRKIAHESSKQSKRNIVPTVEDIMTIEELAERVKSEDAKFIIPYELEDTKNIKEALKEKHDRYYIVIGPEGGFSEKEIEKLIESGGVTVSLGKRILRTETAGIVASSVVLYECDEMKR